MLANKPRKKGSDFLESPSDYRFFPYTVFFSGCDGRGKAAGSASSNALRRLQGPMEGRETKMRLLTKVALGLVVLLVSVAISPAVKADPITIQTGGFSLHNLGNNGAGANGADTLFGDSVTSSHVLDSAGRFVAVLNPLTFIVGFTGPNSEGSYSFSFSQPLTINGLTQMLELSGTIDITAGLDSIHILSSTPLTYNFDTFSVDVNVLPMDIAGDWGATCDFLRAEFIVTQDCNPVPEPATISLLGLGIAGVAAKIRQRRKKLRA